MADALSLVDDWGPEKIVVVSHRRTGMKGVLVIDNTARGIGKGGTRMSPTVTVGEVARLARVMTWKWAGVDLFYGGAKAGIAADPASRDKEAILRAFARALSNEVPREYVMGLDMGLTESDAAIIQDELGDRGAAVGTPEHLGGVAYDKLGVTGYGVAEAADAAAQRRGLSLSGCRVAIQGFGAVGSAAAAALRRTGRHRRGRVHGPRCAARPQRAGRTLPCWPPARSTATTSSSGTPRARCSPPARNSPSTATSWCPPPSRTSSTTVRPT